MTNHTRQLAHEQEMARVQNKTFVGGWLRLLLLVCILLCTTDRGHFMLLVPTAIPFVMEDRRFPVMFHNARLGTFVFVGALVVYAREGGVSPPDLG